MKYVLLPLLLCLFLLRPVAGTAASAGPFAVVTPADHSFVESGTISIVLTAPKKSLDEVRISLNKSDYTFRRSAEKGYVCCEGIRLDRGMNQLRISLLKGREVIAGRTLTVFFRSDLSARSSNPPAGYGQFLFHLPEQEKNCAPCHPLQFSWEDENPKTPQQSRCYTCHRKITVGKFVHPPAEEWGCVTCHSVKPKNGGGGTLAADAKSCANCHTDVMAKWEKKEFRHGPAADAEHCIVCHNPHASELPSLLHMNATDICVSCHEELLARPHVIGAVSAKGGHPVKISPDPYKPGRDFTCASCHNPHAGDAPNFLNNHKPSISLHRFCLSCHVL
ncbi:MAG: hypothetical protein NDI77_03640 [Geobacteraceae bacterium]|nr:hypothetical protein [Geobacteraceae bacterium]